MSLSDDGSAYGRSLNAVLDPRLNGLDAELQARPPMPQYIRRLMLSSNAVMGLIAVWWVADIVHAVPEAWEAALEENLPYANLLFWALFYGRLYVQARYLRPSKARP